MIKLLAFLKNLEFSLVQSLSHVQLFETPWNTACQASLSLTISHILPKFVLIPSVIPSSHLILWHPLLLLPSVFPASGIFPMSRLFSSDDQSTGASASASVLPVNIQGWFPLGLTGLILLSIKLWDTDSHLTCKTLFKMCGLPESGSYLRDISTVVYLRSKRVLNRK